MASKTCQSYMYKTSKTRHSRVIYMYPLTPKCSLWLYTREEMGIERRVTPELRTRPVRHVSPELCTCISYPTDPRCSLWLQKREGASNIFTIHVYTHGQISIYCSWLRVMQSWDSTLTTLTSFSSWTKGGDWGEEYIYIYILFRGRMMGWMPCYHTLHFRPFDHI